MRTPKSLFQYQSSRKLVSWGHHFDSLTEIRFLISVLEEYALIRAPISLYFCPGTARITHFHRTFHLRYTPDFLIRHLETKEAWLIEIKPTGFDNQVQLQQHEQVVSNYIKAMKFDWRYRVIYSDDILLSPHQLEAFEQFRKLKSKHQQSGWLDDYTRRMTPCVLPFRQSQNALIDFVMRGWCSPPSNLFHQHKR